MKDRSSGDADAQHFFQAKGLSTELDVVVVPLSSSASFVLDRQRLGMKLDNVRPSDDPKLMRAKPHSSGDPYS
jgi:hypothetical protein